MREKNQKIGKLSKPFIQLNSNFNSRTHCLESNKISNDTRLPPESHQNRTRNCSRMSPDSLQTCSRIAPESRQIPYSNCTSQPPEFLQNSSRIPPALAQLGSQRYTALTNLQNKISIKKFFGWIFFLARVPPVQHRKKSEKSKKKNFQLFFYFSKSTFNIFIRFLILLLILNFPRFPHKNSLFLQKSLTPDPPLNREN